MTLKLQLTPDLEQRLRCEAERRGLSMEECTLRLLDEHLPPDEHLTPADRAAGLKALLESWMQDDSEEQKETGEYLVRALDEDRLSYRKLFPSVLDDVEKT